MTFPKENFTGDHRESGEPSDSEPTRVTRCGMTRCLLRVVTAACGRPSAVQTGGRHTIPWARRCRGMFFVQKRLVLHLLELPLHCWMPRTRVQSRATRSPSPTRNDKEWRPRVSVTTVLTMRCSSMIRDAGPSSEVTIESSDSRAVKMKTLDIPSKASKCSTPAVRHLKADARCQRIPPSLRRWCRNLCAQGLQRWVSWVCGIVARWVR